MGDLTNNYYTRRVREIDDLCNEFPRTNQLIRLEALIIEMLEEQRAACVQALIEHGHATPTMASIVHNAEIEAREI